MDAEDVTQEVLLVLWQNIENINLKAVKTWVMRTTYNKCIDFIRKRNLMFQREEDINEEKEEVIYELGSVTQPDLILEKKQLQSKIHKAVEMLPEEQKHALILYEIQGMKYKEISNILEIPLNTIKVYIMRARQNLLKELKREKVFDV
jgi:RNA polymerase sigma-70 factor (ECF subfamily)